MSRIAAEAVVILFLIIANGVFAMSEIAVVSARRARLQRRADAGDRRAAAALALATDPNDFLATVQVGITLVGILAGVFGGATIAEEIAAKLDRLPHIAPHGETLSVAIVVAAITYLSVVIGELVPKRIALSNPEGVARLVSKPMRRLARWSRPLIALLTGSANGLMRLMPIRGSKVPAVTDEELTSLLALGTRSGAFHPVEQKMIRGVLALGDRRARMVMTRRQDVVWLDVTRPIEELQQTIREHNFSRFPVGSGSLDQLVGFVELHDIVRASFAGMPLDLRSLSRPPAVFPANVRAVHILEEFHSRGEEFAVIVDEYGGVAGIVTLGDLATTVLGGEEPAIVGAAGSWIVDGMIKFDDFLRRFPLANVEADEYETLAGFVIARMGDLPHLGDRMTYGGYTFEIVDMDGKRIHRVAIGYERDIEPA